MDQAALTKFGDLLDLVYQGALDASIWQHVPQQISAWMQAPQCTLFSPLNTPTTGGFMLAHNLSDQAIALWGAKYHGMDLWAQRAVERGFGVSGAVFRDQDLATEGEFLATQMSREFFAPNNIGRVASGVVFGADERDLMPVVCSCNRPLASPFDMADLERLGLILPHLSRAMGVMFRLRDAEFKVVTSQAAMDRLSCGVVLIGGEGQLLFVNRRAQSILEERDGLFMATMPAPRLGLNALASSYPDTQHKLLEAIREVMVPANISSTHFSKVLRVTRPSGLSPYALQFSPLPPGNELGLGTAKPVAIVFIHEDKVRIACDAEVLRAHFGISLAESRVIEGIVNGASVAEVAASLDISVNTVKTHLSHVYEKSGAHSQAQLIKLVVALTSV